MSSIPSSLLIPQSVQNQETANRVAITVAAKQQKVVKEQGEALVALIDQAAAISEPQGDSKGLDVVA